MKTAKETLQSITSNGMRKLTDERTEQALKEYAKEAINEVLKQYNKKNYETTFKGGSLISVYQIGQEVIDNLK